jgi:alpha-beta hydrolase superfamily lysophospholipase
MPSRPSIFQARAVQGAGVELWMGSAAVPGAIRAEVLLTHGLGEHASRYEHVAGYLAEHGVRLHAYDLRGHGRSGGRRGDAPRYEALLDDLECVQAALPREQGRPLFLMGHSLGGQITLRYLLSRPVECRGAVIASPWLRLAFSPCWWRRLMARAALRFWPAWGQRTPTHPLELSRDEEHVRSLAWPELVHHRISARLFFAIEMAGAETLREAERLGTPVLLLHGGDDSVTCVRATCDFYERAGCADKTLRVFPEVRHETHNDVGREEVLREVAEWIGRRGAAVG